MLHISINSSPEVAEINIDQSALVSPTLRSIAITISVCMNFIENCFPSMIESGIKSNEK